MQAMEAVSRQLKIVAAHNAGESAQEFDDMQSSSEHPVVAASDEYWDIDDVRLFRSTDPNVLLFAPTRVTLARSGRNGRCQASLTQFRSMKEGIWSYVGGSALLVLSSAVQSPAAPQRFAERWRNVLFEQGYAGNLNPVFLPLPRRRQRLKLRLDYENGYSRTLSEDEFTGKTASVAVELTGKGALDWERAIREKLPLRGQAQWSFEYPRMLPDAEACFNVEGNRVTTHPQPEASDLSLRLIFRARTWAEMTITTDLATLLHELDESHLHVVPVEASCSFPIVVRTDPNDAGLDD